MDLVPFLLASLLVELTPGPNMAWLAIVGVSQGRSRGFAAVAGVALGLAIVGALAAMGLGGIVSASPLLYELLRWAGVLWLLWLAWDGWREAGEALEEVPSDWGLGRYFRRGLVTNLLNPKAAVFFLAVLPTFTDPTRPILPQTLTLSAAFVVLATLIHGTIVALAGLAAPLLQDPRRARLLRRTLSASLALVALWFAWETA